MTAASTITPPDAAPAPRRSMRLATAVGAVAATAVNAAVWGVGRIADVSFAVTPLGAEAETQVGLVTVILTTAIIFALGMAVFALAANRSRRWSTAVLACGVLFAAVSAAVGPLPAAEDTATALLLTTMHVVTGAVFAATALKARG